MPRFLYDFHPLPHMGKIPFDFGARTSHETLGVVSHVPFEKYIEREGGKGKGSNT